MSIEGQGHFFTIYFPGFVCFVLYKATIYQVSVYITIGPLVQILFTFINYMYCIVSCNSVRCKDILLKLFSFFNICGKD